MSSLILSAFPPFLGSTRCSFDSCILGLIPLHWSFVVAFLFHPRSRGDWSAVAWNAALGVRCEELNTMDPHVSGLMAPYMIPLHVVVTGKRVSSGIK